jgi:cytosine/adenosine deaminase-related metal-dependent hydrolase
MTPMRTSHSRGLTFVNADMAGTAATTLRIAGSRISALGEPPRRGDSVLDLHGDRLLPGLINAHDHLQLNSLCADYFAAQFSSAREWIAAINSLRSSDAAFEASITLPRADRLLIGGLKNLLSGVTTVAHHDPLYAPLRSPRFPVHVVTDYVWAHSLYIDGDEKVQLSYRGTPPEWPWIIHAAEGVDQDSELEFERLDFLGCIGANTLLVHGVALHRAQRERLRAAGAGLIWCPSSNLRILGRTAEVGDLLAAGCVALGTDSRLSGSCDLLAELRAASAAAGCDAQALEPLVTTANARLLRLRDRGTLAVGTRADLLVLPAGRNILQVTRADVRLVMVDGAARYGDRDYMEAVAAQSATDVRIEGRAKMLDASLVAQLSAAVTREPGVELPGAKGRAA